RVPEGRMRARAKRGPGPLHHRRATRAGPHPALRATFSRARAREKGKCEANLARVPVTLPLLRNGPLPLARGEVYGLVTLRDPLTLTSSPLRGGEGKREGRGEVYARRAPGSPHWQEGSVAQGQ